MNIILAATYDSVCRFRFSDLRSLVLAWHGITLRGFLSKCTVRPAQCSGRQDVESVPVDVSFHNVILQDDGLGNPRSAAVQQSSELPLDPNHTYLHISFRIAF